MNSREIIKKLRADGFDHIRTTGDHHIYTHSDGRLVIVPHPQKDFPIGTLRSIFKQAGWAWKK